MDVGDGDDDITRMLAAARGGDVDAWQRLVTLIYGDLRRIAHRQLIGRRSDTLDTTGLVHESYLRLAGNAASINDREHFFALAARVMRQVVVDYARERIAGKRGGGERPIPLQHVDVAELREAQQLLELDELLRRLVAVNERQARVIECRFFAGLSEPETAAALGISERTVQREWAEARAWLRREGQANEAG